MSSFEAKLERYRELIKSIHTKSTLMVGSRKPRPKSLAPIKRTNKPVASQRVTTEPEMCVSGTSLQLNSNRAKSNSMSARKEVVEPVVGTLPIPPLIVHTSPPRVSTIPAMIFSIDPEEIRSRITSIQKQRAEQIESSCISSARTTDDQSTLEELRNFLLN